MENFKKISKKRAIQNLSWGLASRMSDLALISLFLGLSMSMPSRHAGKFLSQLFNKLAATENEEKIRTALYQLKRHGLINYSRRLWQEPQITAQGKKRLQSLLPVYLESRPWDKKLYLVCYDIPEKFKRERNKLRRMLKTLGAGLLQESVWLTPYNPKKILKDFVGENNLVGLVLVSDLGKDGSIGEEDNRELVARVYQLDQLNQRYWEFIDHWQKKKPKPEMLAYFFSILKDDPQLPFELLPDDWLGEKAWELISSLMNSVSD